MASFTKAPDDVLGRVGRIMGRYHGHLVDVEVTVGVLMSHTPVKLHGYPCAATVKIVGLEQRVLGVEDALLEIDARAWADLTDESRDALIDHELHHLVPQFDKDGDLKSDDHGRPVLKMRLHTWQLGGFDVIAGRHGPAALEVQAFRAVSTAFHQQLFRRSDDSAPADEPSGSSLHRAVATALESTPLPPGVDRIELLPDPRNVPERFECADCGSRRPCTDHPCPNPDCESSAYRVIRAGAPIATEALDRIAGPLPDGVCACGACHHRRPIGESPCPRCGSPEFRLNPATPVGEGPKRTRRAKAAAGVAP